MERIVEMSVEIHTGLVKCPHYSSCLMQAVNDSLHTEALSCVHCPSYQHEVIKENKAG